MGDHTETVEVDFDPAVTTYEDLLTLFWRNHCPTRRGSRQYMSAIFYHSDAQRQAAETTKQEEQNHLAQPITTTIAKAGTFYNAEGYHQKYMLRQKSALMASLGLTEDELISSHVASRLNGFAGGHGSLDLLNKEWKELGLSRDQTDLVKRCISTRR